MTRITQISAAALLAVFASTSFVPVANAHGKKVWCKQVSAKVFRTACETQKPRRYQSPTSQQPIRVVNFRGAEIVSDGGNGGGGNGGSGGNGGGGGAAGGRP